MSSEDHFPEFAVKMRAAGLTDPTIRAFQRSYESLTDRPTLLIHKRESKIRPVDHLPRFDEVSENQAEMALLAQTVVLKLNGGLGTGMGLAGPKSLLEIRDGLTFLDITARQILHQREHCGVPLRLLLMNSFSTSRPTLEALLKYPQLGNPQDLELMQSMVPKVDATTHRPVSWPGDPELEWCPPGHGDIYPSLVVSGWLDRWLGEGMKYLFVSNFDNLGATLDLHLLTYFAHSNQAFLMEVAERTVADRKGGHLAMEDGRLTLRERAQCPDCDMEYFEDVERHRFFNTNNLWIRLDELRMKLQFHEGFLPLAVIKNEKTVDPRDKSSPKVIQLETAMGSALECFENSGAIVVPRSRFAPVKATSDMLMLRSDAYELTDDWRMLLAPSRQGVPPTVSLDDEHYKFVDQFEEKLRDGVPSLIDCQELTVRGPVAFHRDVRFRGKVKVTNSHRDVRPLAPGDYCDVEVAL